MRWLQKGFWALPVLSIAITAVILWQQQHALQTLRTQLAAKARLRARATADVLERHLDHVAITLWTISAEPSVRQLRDNSRDYIAEIYEQNYEHHRLAEVYIIERGFDGRGRPFMTFEHAEGNTPSELLHTPEHEAAEYAVQREHIERFAAHPEVRNQLSRPLMLCIGQPGIIYSVPIRETGQLRGIVAGMIPSSILVDLMTVEDATEGLLLLDPAGGVIVQNGAAAEAVAGAADAIGRLARPGGPQTLQYAALDLLSEPVSLPEGKPWRLIHLHDPTAQLNALGIATTAPGIGMGSVVVLLGLVAGVLCHTTAELIRVRRKALARAEELSHVARVSTMNELAAGLAHEINQPLTAIATYAEACACRTRKGQRLDPEFLSDLAAISGQAERATEIVERLRRFIARRPAQRGLADMNALVRESVQLLDAAIRAADVDVRLRLGPDLPPVLVDAVQIVQVLVNLQRNAVEALLSQPAETRHVTVETTSRGRHEIEVAVEDTGSGLADSELAALFTPFRSTKPHGLGLGLSISRTIVEAHGGRLAAARGAGRGLRFAFTLPAADEARRSHKER